MYHGLDFEAEHNNEQIAAAKAAAQSVIDANNLRQEDGENPLAALGWAMGEQIEHENALIRFAAAVIKADRAARYHG